MNIRATSLLSRAPFTGSEAEAVSGKPLSLLGKPREAAQVCTPALQTPSWGDECLVHFQRLRLGGNSPSFIQLRYGNMQCSARVF